MDENIAITVDFDAEDQHTNVGSIQIVPMSIQWEDFELMVRLCTFRIVTLVFTLSVISCF